MVGMRRAKKQKVEARSEVREAAPVEETLDELLEQSHAAADAPPAEPPAAASPGSIKRQAAEEELEELSIEMEVAEKVAAHLQRELTMHQALYDAKMRRVEAAQSRKARGSAVLQLERIYQAEIDLLKAKLSAAEASADAHNAEANWLAQRCSVLRFDAAKLQRSVRRLPPRAR